MAAFSRFAPITEGYAGMQGVETSSAVMLFTTRWGPGHFSLNRVCLCFFYL